MGLFCTDVYHATPIENISKSNFTAVMPKFASWYGSNHRLFYGTYENARLQADRFGFLEEFESKYIITYDPKNSNITKGNENGYHSKYYLGKLIAHFKMDVEYSVDICVWRIHAEGTLLVGDCMKLRNVHDTLPNGFE